MDRIVLMGSISGKAFTLAPPQLDTNLVFCNSREIVDQCLSGTCKAALLPTARVQAPERGVFEARIDIVGDVAVGLQLSTVLEAFFSRFPFELAT